MQETHVPVKASTGVYIVPEQRYLRFDSIFTLRLYRDMSIITVSLNAYLNEKGYILLRLGHPSDRIFGTK
jgi:hypothetical protein